MPQIGEKISFTPSAFFGPSDYGKLLKGMPRKVTAVVESINTEHRYYRARFELRGQTMHECFKF